MAWLLIVISINNHGNVYSVVSFPSEQVCEQAKKEVRASDNQILMIKPVVICKKVSN